MATKSSRTDAGAYKRAMVKKAKDNWITFLHPQSGRRVAGLCIAARTLPDRSDRIPDISLKLRGKSGQVVEVSLVETRAFIHGSEREAAQAVEDQHPIPQGHYL